MLKNMNFTSIKKYKFKEQFRHILFYSVPTSILLVVKKRFNLILLVTNIFLFYFIALF